MKQLGLGAPLFVKKPKLTKRQQFLQEMERVIPWVVWVSRIAPHYPKAGRGRRPFALETMLRIHLLQQWFGYSDPAMEIVDATLIAAPPSTKNRERKRDPEMTSTKKGNNYYFGMKAPIGVDAESGLVHTVAVTTAKVADGVMTDALVHGEEQIVLGDRVYTRNDRNPDAECPPGEPVWAFPFKRKSGEALPVEQAEINRWLASVRAAVEHPFRIVKRQFGYAKIRYRGLYKNGQQLFLLFALGNLFHARGALMAA